MSDRPDKCQYCECSAVASDHNHARRFLCGTVWNIEHQSWECCINCARLCVTPLMELRKRVAVAVAAAKQADRFDVIEWDGSTAVVREDDNQYAWATSLDELVAILEGKQ